MVGALDGRSLAAASTPYEPMSACASREAVPNTLDMDSLLVSGEIGMGTCRRHAVHGKDPYACRAQYNRRRFGGEISVQPASTSVASVDTKCSGWGGGSLSVYY